MKKNILIFCLLISIPIVLLSQNVIERAPLNPDFVQYMSQKNSGLLRTTTHEGFVLGEIPSPIKRDFSSYVNTKAAVGDAVYDLRTAGVGGTSLLTSVKNQGNCGSCWTFATFGSIESRWKILGNGDTDLSEDNLNNCHGFEWAPCDGGNLDLAAAYLSRKSGPLSEADDPYTATPGSCPSGLLEQAYVTDIVYLPNDQNTIKQALIDYGALYTNMCWKDPSYNSSNKTYYYNGSEGTNHAVLLVGWDNNKSTAGGTGAWIIKNSWGSGWGESGYFYISYNDTKVHTTVGYFPNRIDYNADAHLYSIDELGSVSGFGYGVEQASGLVKYVATGNQQITKIGTWLNASNSTIDIDIYDSFNGTSLSGLLGSLSSQSKTMPGYYTFELTTPIDILNGNDFYVRIKYNTPSYTYPVPIEMSYPDYSDATIETGVCWMSYDGTSGWTALGGGTSYPYDICTKAYALTVYPDLLVNVTNQTVSEDITYNNVNIESDASLTLDNTYTLSVRGDFVIESDASGTGSFIQNGTLDVSGDIIVQKYLPNTTTSGWTLSAPVQGATHTVFDGSDNIYYYSPTSANWLPFGTGTLAEMTGYVVRFPLTKTLAFEGTLNNGAISRNNFIRQASPNNYGWNYTGNPYPSPIDWDLVVGDDNQVFVDNTHLNAAIHIREADGGIMTYLPNVEVSPDRIIPAMQAFWVQVNSSYTTASLSLNNTHRVHGANNILKSFNNKILTLEIERDTYKDKTKIYFKSGASDYFEGAYDAVKLYADNMQHPQIYTTDADNQALAINSLPELKSARLITMGFKTSVDGIFTFSAKDIALFDNHFNVVLEDLYNNTLTDLRQQNTYVFSSSVDNTSERFNLHFIPQHTSNNIQISDNEIMIYAQDNIVYIMNTQEDASSVCIYNILGQEVLNQELKGNELNKIETKLSSGQYIVKLFSKTQTITQKVFLGLTE